MLLTAIGDNLVDEPGIRPLSYLLIAVHLLVAVTPFRQDRRVRPQRYLSLYVYELEMAALGMPCLAIVRINNVDLEEGLIVSRFIISRHGGEFLVGWHERRCYIVSQKHRIRPQVEKLDDVVLTNNSTSTAVRDFTSWNDLPVVVVIVIFSRSHLLTLTADSTVVVTEWVLVLIRGQVRLGILVL